MNRIHPNLQTFLGNYGQCLEQMGRSPEEIRTVLGELLRQFGFQLRYKMTGFIFSFIRRIFYPPAKREVL